MKTAANKAYIYIILCIVSWAFIPVCSKKVLSGMDSFAMMFFSNLISALTIGLYILISNKSKLFYAYSKRDYMYMSFLGFLGTFLYYIFLYSAFSITKAQEVFIINYLWPILVVLLAIFILKEPLTLIKIISIGISFMGVVIIATKGKFLYVGFGNMKGDLLAFFGAAVFALFSVLGKQAKYDKSIAVFIYFVISFVASFVFLPFMNVHNINVSVIFWLIINGVFANGISYVFWFKALSDGRVHIMSNLVYLTPFVSLIFIQIFLDEKVQYYSLEALALIILGILLQTTSGYIFKKSVT